MATQENNIKESRKSISDEITDKKCIKSGELPIKIYSPRNSMLIDLVEENKHVRTAYHILLTIFLSLFINLVLDDYFNEREIRFGFRLIYLEFKCIHNFALIWICLFISSLFIYTGFKYWATQSIQFKPQSTQLKVWNRLWLLAFILYISVFMSLATYARIVLNLSTTLSVAILIEATRLLMKIYAFVRSNTPRVLNYKQHTETKIIDVNFSHYLYFLFAPTAVYRDSYPKSTTKRRWDIITLHLFEMFGAIILLSLIIERSVIFDFKEYGLRKYPWQEVVIKIFQNTGIAMLLFITSIFCLLHSWHNIFAELMGFSDKLFYKDWWVSKDFSRYFRTWNVVVHDWLYTYVYKDFYEIVIPKNKTAAKYVTFFISALVHEYILVFSYKFCIPILFIQFFFISVPLTDVKFKSHIVGNVFLFYAIAIGVSMDLCIYSMEYYSRLRCPVENVTFSSYFIPRLIYCNQ